MINLKTVAVLLTILQFMYVVTSQECQQQQPPVINNYCSKPDVVRPQDGSAEMIKGKPGKSGPKGDKGDQVRCKT